MSELAAHRPRLAGTHGRAVVELDDLTVTFPRRDEPVLSAVSLRLAPGQQVVVLGASGSGKSTLLHAITGVIPHTVTATVTGEVIVAGTTTEATCVVERSRHLGVLAQDPSAAVCLPQVEQELALPLENHATEPASIGPRIRAALDTIGAGHLRQRATAVLSGGESQRVALAAALVTGPEVLLLDEPTSMLDPAGVASVRGALTGAIGRYRPAMVLIEHRLDEWAGVAGTAGLPGRAVVLGDDGTVLADGSTAVVLREHAGMLHAAGCWLPLDAEFYALTDAAGDLGSRVNTDLLHVLADQPVPRRSGGQVLLSARGLAVGRAESASKKQWRGHPGAVPEAQASCTLLADVDLTVRAGEVIALLGGNGVGKSTLLLTLARLLSPLAGIVGGSRPGLVFQNPEHQFVATTVREEIGHGLPAETKQKVVDAQLRRHRLTHLAGQNPFQLSGGEKRRLSLAAMLAHDRPVLLIDEPTLGLDRRDAIGTAMTLRDVADRGDGVVLVSHDLRLVAGLADRVVILGNGGVLADGPTEQVLSDACVLAQAGLTLPPLVAWLLEHTPGATAHVLGQLDDAVVPPRREELAQ
ncbi:MAG: ABC transporter ATP-binding protein [Ornithinimicrobium sp.]|uniref:ABC transporter ATP-binding protein n=1 Tax=Ornithinimicrobium sp. TaxID=1977084 RepID=UPI003D9B78F7